MNRTTEMIIDFNFISINDGKIKNQVPTVGIEKIIETINHFFLREKSGNTFIIPKNQIHRATFVKAISNLNILVEYETKWRWK